MLQQDNPDDYVIATNETHTIREFLEVSFGHVGLDWEKYVEIDPRYFRPAEVDLLIGDPAKAKKALDWAAENHLQRARPHHDRRRRGPACPRDERQSLPADGRVVSIRRLEPGLARAATAESAGRLIPMTASSDKIFVAGHRGLVGSAIVRAIEKARGRRTVGDDDSDSRRTRPARRRGGAGVFRGRAAGVGCACGGESRRDQGEQRFAGRVPARKPEDSEQHHRVRVRGRGGEAAVPGQLVHLPEVCPAADPAKMRC